MSAESLSRVSSKSSAALGAAPKPRGIGAIPPTSAERMHRQVLGRHSTRVGRGRAIYWAAKPQSFGRPGKVVERATGG